MHVPNNTFLQMKLFCYRPRRSFPTRTKEKQKMKKKKITNHRNIGKKMKFLSKKMKKRKKEKRKKIRKRKLE
jgi:hypothetical protein